MSYWHIVFPSLNVFYLVLKLPAETLIDIHISFVGKGGHDDYSSWHSVFGEHRLWDNRQWCSEGVRGITRLVKSYCGEFSCLFLSQMLVVAASLSQFTSRLDHRRCMRQLSTIVNCIFKHQTFSSAVFSVWSVKTVRKKKSTLAEHA